MRRRQCTRCGKILGPEVRLCVVCGGETGAAGRRLGRAATGVGVALLAVSIILALSFSDRYAPVVSDWYSRMVIHYVPDTALRFTTDETDRAFYVCARSVVKQIDEMESVVTFAAVEDALTRDLGEGRFRLESYVEEATPEGPTYRRAFTCTLRRDGTDWSLEGVELEAIAPPAEASERAA